MVYKLAFFKTKCCNKRLQNIFLKLSKNILEVFDVMCFESFFKLIRTMTSLKWSDCIMGYVSRKYLYLTNEIIYYEIYYLVCSLASVEQTDRKDHP